MVEWLRIFIDSFSIISLFSELARSVPILLNIKKNLKILHILSFFSCRVDDYK